MTQGGSQYLRLRPGCLPSADCAPAECARRCILISRGSRFHASAVSFSPAARPSSRSSDASRCPGELPDGMHVDLGQPRPGDRAHSPHQLDRQVVKEVELGAWIDNHEPVGLGHLRGYFRKVLGPRHADRDRQAKLDPYAMADCACDICWWTKEMRAASNVGKGLVDGNSFDERREVIEHRDGGIAQPLVVLEVTADKGQLRAEFARPTARHAAPRRRRPWLRKKRRARHRHRPRLACRATRGRSSCSTEA